MRLNSSIPLDSVKDNLDVAIHCWIYNVLRVSYSIFLVTFTAHNGPRELESPELA